MKSMINHGTQCRHYTVTESLFYFITGELTQPVSSSVVPRTLSAARRQPLHLPTRPAASNRNLSKDISSKISNIFNWNPKSAVGCTKKRKSGGKSGSAKKRIPTWTHVYVCLSNCFDNSVPDSDERARLQMAGLGEKKITLYLCSEAYEINQELLFQFPKLSDGGGFELLRVPDCGGKQLDIIAIPESGYSASYASYLKAVVHHAKVYIRSMQRNLSLEPVKQEVSKGTTLL